MPRETQKPLLFNNLVISVLVITLNLNPFLKSMILSLVFDNIFDLILILCLLILDYFELSILSYILISIFMNNIIINS